MRDCNDKQTIKINYTKSNKPAVFLPDSLGDNARRIITHKNMASEALHGGVLGDEPNVAMVAGVKSTEGNIFQRVEVIYARPTLAFLLKIETV